MTTAWVLLNLLVSNVLVGYMPPNVWQFITAMWFPALSAIAFLLIERQPLRAGLNLFKGTTCTYAVALTIPLVVCLFTILLGWSSGYLIYQPTLKPGSLIPTFIFWIFAALGEELGWRGYLQNHLKNQKHAPLIIGIIWFAWHLKGISPSMAPMLLADTILVSYLLAWMIEAGGSVWACGLFHGLWDFLRMKVVLGLFVTKASYLTEMEGAFGLLPLVVMCWMFGRLYYRRYALRTAGNTALEEQATSA